MVVMIAMRIIRFFYIAISNLYVMSPVIPMGKKTQKNQKKLSIMEETISLTMCFFTLKLVRALYSLILLIFVLNLVVLVTNTDIIKFM